MNKENDEMTKSAVNALARTVNTFVAEVLYNVKIYFNNHLQTIAQL